MKIHHTPAMTLTELIVASVIIGIVMVGIVSIDFALRRSHLGTSRNSLLSMQTSHMLLEISKDAQLATGDQTNPGIDIQPPLGPPPYTLCIRRENPAAPPLTPADYSDDQWVCYSHDTVTNRLYKCIDPNNPVVCTGGPGDTDLGTISAFVPTLLTNPLTNDFSLDIDIISIYNPNVAVNVIDNPANNMHGRFNLISHSF